MAPSSSEFTLPRSRRIRKGPEFALTRSAGKRLATGCLILNWRPLPDAASNSRVGVVTSKKLGNAVVRNRSRRLLREVFRRHQHDFACPVDLVLVARNSIVGKGFAQVERDFMQGVRQARLLRDNP